MNENKNENRNKTKIDNILRFIPRTDWQSQRPLPLRRTAEAADRCSPPARERSALAPPRPPRRRLLLLLLLHSSCSVPRAGRRCLWSYSIVTSTPRCCCCCCSAFCFSGQMRRMDEEGGGRGRRRTRRIKEKEAWSYDKGGGEETIVCLFARWWHICDVGSWLTLCGE